MGVSYTALQSSCWRRVGRGMYSWDALPDDPWKLLAAYQRLWPMTVFAGCSAGWLHGLDTEPVQPIEVIAARASEIRSRPGVIVHHIDIAPSEIVDARGLRATTARRTLKDLGHRLSRREVLVLADAALRLGLGRFDDHAEPAESPMETRLRWLLLKAGLPGPQVQTELKDGQGRFLGRADLYYPQARLVIEYDGRNHRERLVEDNRRQNMLVNAGFSILRFTSSDMRDEASVAALVRRALSAAAAVSATPPAAGRR